MELDEMRTDIESRLKKQETRSKGQDKKYGIAGEHENPKEEESALRQDRHKND